MKRENHMQTSLHAVTDTRKKTYLIKVGKAFAKWRVCNIALEVT